ncbi:hypothetical protein BY458DRAFT_558931 [Sporodiniella umbellata]|nr:hypothetical protein BY458DRAFT_558931 [Sporodiniella umbellata]
MHERVKKENTRTDLDEAQQKRVAARAANAMAQVIQRRNRSLMIWGKKSVIKRYPDGRQEIVVPQVLTAEQEQYEFPPRSKLLKKLAVTERVAPPTPEHAPLPPDPSALKDYFQPKSSCRGSIAFSQDKHSNRIQFKSDTGKRWTTDLLHTLQAPSPRAHTHYVPRRLLVHPPREITETASCIQSLWKEYQRHPQQSIESKIASTAMAHTGERTPMAGMVHLVHQMNQKLKQLELASIERNRKYEALLKQERKKKTTVS